MYDVATAAAAADVRGIKAMTEFAPTVGAVTLVEVAPVDDSVTVPVALVRPSINCRMAAFCRRWSFSFSASHSAPPLIAFPQSTHQAQRPLRKSKSSLP